MRQADVVRSSLSSRTRTIIKSARLVKVPFFKDLLAFLLLRFQLLQGVDDLATLGLPRHLSRFCDARGQFLFSFNNILEFTIFSLTLPNFHFSQ